MILVKLKPNQGRPRGDNLCPTCKQSERQAGGPYCRPCLQEYNSQYKKRMRRGKRRKAANTRRTPQSGKDKIATRE